MAALHRALSQADLDQVLGPKQRGQRPVLIVSNEAFNQGMTDVIVLHLTSSGLRRSDVIRFGIG